MARNKYPGKCYVCSKEVGVGKGFFQRNIGVGWVVKCLGCPGHAVIKSKNIKMETNKQCSCACHDNKLNKPYEHDRRCCDEMNGHIGQWWEDEYRKAEILHYSFNDGTEGGGILWASSKEVRKFIGELLQQHKQRILEKLRHGHYLGEDSDETVFVPLSEVRTIIENI